VRNVATKNMTIRIDEQVKKDAEKFFDDLGLSMTTAINMFIKMTLKQNKIPFELTGDPFYNSYNIKSLENILKDIKSGKEYTTHELIEVEDE